MNARIGALVGLLLPATAFAAEWQTDYANALKSARDRDVPVFVYFSADQPGDVEKLKPFAERFVLLKVVQGEGNADKLYNKFAMDGAEGCCVIDRTQEWQFVRYERKLTQDELKRVLKRTQNAEGLPVFDAVQLASHEEPVLQPVESTTISPTQSYFRCTT